MAVTVRNYTLNPFWNSDDFLNVIQTALADIGYHAAAQTGTILTFSNSAGTTIAGEKGKRYLVKQSATSGSGVNCTFDVVRNAATGAIATVTLVNGGTGYANGNTVTLQGSDLGGATPTDNVTVTVSTVSGSQGTASTWYKADSANPYTWGVCCVNNNVAKKMGQTYYAFYMPASPVANPTLYIRSGAGFQSNTNVFNGVAALDYNTSNTPNSTTQQNYSQVVATSNAVQLTLTTYQSAIDTNFVIWQFSEQTSYGRLYRAPFFLSKYESGTQPWSLDDCFTGGIYEIFKVQVANTYDSYVGIQTYTAPMAKRQAEWGYGNLQGTFANGRPILAYYESLFGKRYNTGATQQNPTIYQRTKADLVHTALDYNPVITGLPICHSMIPVPYFMPADFGITEVVGTNSIAYGDKITVGGAQWTIIQYGNNQAAATYNSAMAFLARTT